MQATPDPIPEPRSPPARPGGPDATRVQETGCRPCLILFPSPGRLRPTCLALRSCPPAEPIGIRIQAHLIRIRFRAAWRRTEESTSDRYSRHRYVTGQASTQTERAREGGAGSRSDRPLAPLRAKTKNEFGRK